MELDAHKLLMESNDELNDSKIQECRNKFTIENLKKCEGFENCTNEELDEYIDAMFQFGKLAYKLFRKDKIKQSQK